jgi:hypothetical protein
MVQIPLKAVGAEVALAAVQGPIPLKAVGAEVALAAVQGPNQALVAPREARTHGMGRKPMPWVVVTQWVRTGDGSRPT